MKRNALFAILFTLIMGVLFIACPNSTDPDPSPDPDPKPTELPSNATYDDVMSKLDEIIKFCDEHPGNESEVIKQKVQEIKDGIKDHKDDWESFVTENETLISDINDLIHQVPDTPITIAGTDWSDGLKPETTLSFLVNNTVRLGGDVSPAADNKNWYWGNLPSTLPFDLVEGADAVRDLVDQVEDNWGTNITLPNAVIVVWTDSANKIGFQLHYYKAVASGKNYERLVCWGLSSPHEFKKK